MTVRPEFLSHRRDARPLVMGVVNVTPDSFSDGGRFHAAEAAVAHALRLAEDGADILDIGGESTRPGAEAVEEADELARVIPVIEHVAKRSDVPISIDTRKAAVMSAAVAAGASVINDVSALTYDPDSPAIVAALKTPVILMHARGDPKTMQDDPHYDDVVAEVLAFLRDRLEAAVAAGVDRNAVIVDPGIGFGKTLAHNLALLDRLDAFAALGCPVLLGASRKRFIAALDDDAPADGRLGGSLAAALIGAQKGAAIVRVHDVRETVQALKVFSAVGAVA